MKNYCFRYTLIIGVIFVCMNVNAQYETVRLSRIDEIVDIMSDSIKGKLGRINSDSTFLFRNRILSIKMNCWGEIQNIGYSLFPNEICDTNLSYIYDFVERYLLELDLLNKKSELKKRLRHDDVTLSGDFPSILDEHSSDIQFSIEDVEYHRYKLNFKRGTKNIQLDFSPNCQLILGANDKELEEIFSRHFRQFLKGSQDSSQYSLIIDMYGNKRDSINCTLYDILCFIEHENCQMIFRQDEDNNDVMFAINKKLDYIHMAILKEDYAYMYVYIPIHTYPEFFINQIKEEQ